MKKSWILVSAAIAVVAVGSVAVLATSGDDSRRQGALGEADSVALSWHGDWSEEVEYARGNVVSHEGASYVADGEKFAAPAPDCADCGWTLVGAELIAAETEQAAPKEEPKPEPGPVSGYERLQKSVSVAGNSNGSVELICPAGKAPTAGGGVDERSLFSSWPGMRAGVPSWNVTFHNDLTVPETFHAWAVCVDVG
jgi:hypothetical protein